MLRPSLATIALVPSLALALVTGACVDGQVTEVEDDGSVDDMDDELPEDYDPGDRPGGAGAMYSVCADSSVCTPLEFCVFPQGEAGFCSDACASGEDASVCDVAPDGEVRAFCLDIGLPDNRRVCAIDCEGGRPCPRGMRCEEVDSAGSARSVCF
jgi:hypothetical protein